MALKPSGKCPERIRLGKIQRLTYYYHYYDTFRNGKSGHDIH